MEAAKFWSVASLAFVLVLCITSTSVTWHCLNEVVRLQSRVERLEAEDKGISVSELLGQLGVQTPVYQGVGAEEDIPGHQREVRQTALHDYIQQIVQSQLEVYLGVTTTETDSKRSKRSTLTPRQWNPLKGQKGEPGPPGPPGTRGRSGRKGNKGEQGVPGERGEKGDMGTIGEKGERGDTGLTGPVGEKGDKGNNGQKGDSGSQGLVGGKGEKGERGDTGPIGSVGAKSQHGDPGPPGEKGDKGDTGSQGPLGGKGDKGEAGLTGPAGEKGVQGNDGQKGDMGLPGPVGERGDTGLTGPEGQPGDPGSKGSSGEKGQKGERGAKGDEGRQDIPGEQGPKGEKGGGLIGDTHDNPANSCSHLSQQRPAAPSGYYWVLNATGTPIRVYCAMDIQCGCGETGGWTRVVSINTTDTSVQCPTPFREITTPRRTCGRRTATVGGCDSSNFNVEVSYSRVCGRVIGYQVASPDGFLGATQGYGLDGPYVDGISLTRGSPRQHVWSFGGTPSETFSTSSTLCPCSNTGITATAPSFVGNDYFCETARVSGHTSEFYDTNDRLWDGKDCGSTSTCCSFNTPPWFCKQLPQSRPDDIELRLCTQEPYYHDDTPFELVELYVQ